MKLVTEKTNNLGKQHAEWGKERVCTTQGGETAAVQPPNLPAPWGISAGG